MHTDAEKAASGRFKSLIASGWHIAAISVREFHRAGGYGNTPVVGLGVDEEGQERPALVAETMVQIFDK